MPDESADPPESTHLSPDTGAPGPLACSVTHPASGDEEPPTPPVARFPVVAIGASAGGLEALEALLRRLVTEGMAFVVLQHLAPDHESALADILAHATPMKVMTIRDGAPATPDVVHVAPPDAEVSILRGAFHLQPLAEPTPRHLIDSFFRSLAAERGPMAIGVVLSGAGSDGTLGLEAIRDEGGITFVQEPSTAGHPGMPRSALDAGVADFCLTPSEIADELIRLGAHPFGARRRAVRLWGEDSMRALFERLRRRFGVDFSAYKQSTIERRIVRRMALQKVEHVEEYLKLVEASPAELDVLYGDLLIGVTSFFRDAEPFQVLGDVLFPRLLEKRSAERPIRVWVAGCSTGEEAYSVAICLLEHLGDRAPGYKIQIFATDIDEQALDAARLGVYPQSIELALSSERLRRFFSRHEKGYQVSRQVRDLIVFARHTLGKDPPFSRLDLVTCRNVLIYMQPVLQRRVLRVFHYALNPDAFLLLGTSESVGDGADLFTLIERRVKVYRKKNLPSAAVFDFAFGPWIEQEDTRGAGGAAAPEHRPTATVQQLADRKVIERYGPPGVLLNERMEVIQFRGQTGPFLAPAPGAATFNIFKLARPEVLIELRPALQQAQERGMQVTSKPIHPWEDRGSSVTIDVLPVTDQAAQRKCLLVLFREARVDPGRPDEAGAPQEERSPRSRSRVIELERELVTTKEYLQTTVQELETTNEELQSANEELQSANEELATVNDELQSRMIQLAVSNDDLQNVLATMRTSPYHTADHTIRGAIVELTRAPHARKGDAGAVPGLDGKLLSALPDPVVLLNGELRVVWGNKRLFEVFGFGAEILGVPLDELWPADEGDEPFWKAVAATAGGLPFGGVRVARPFGRDNVAPMSCTGYRVPEDGEHGALMVLTMREIPPDRTHAR